MGTHYFFLQSFADLRSTLGVIKSQDKLPLYFNMFRIYMKIAYNFPNKDGGGDSSDRKMICMVGFGCSVRKSLCTLNLYSGLIQHTKFGKYTTEAFYDTKVPSLAVQIITDVVFFYIIWRVHSK